MNAFYSLMLYMTQFELAIARSTGRNPASIAALSQDEQRWLHAITLREVRYVRG